MKVTYNWLKDFVKLNISANTLADKLTMAGLEVTSLEEKGGDFVFEMEITSNRPDLLSVIGIAREVAAITNKKFKDVSGIRYQVSGRNVRPVTCDVQPFLIKIQDKKDCPLYTAKIIKDVKVGPSPDWLKKRLELVGCHSVNNIVDITNYVLWESGQPLHAFDIDKLSVETIIVRRAKRDEKLTTIDGQEHILDANILIIADKEKPIAIAGVMGGRDTEVSEDTKNILLESAIFNPIIVRRGRQRLGLTSESAYRFERGVDLETVQKASWQAVGLMQKVYGGRCVFNKESGLIRHRKRKVNLDISAVNKILGTSIAPKKIKGILNKLGFKVTSKPVHKNPATTYIEVPAYRADISSQIDLIEELARIYGYEHIPRTLPKLTAHATIFETRETVYFIKNILVGLGLNEVLTYSMIDKDLWNTFRITGENNAIEIINPLSKEQEILRPTLIPSLARCIAYNLNQRQERLSIFELAQIFRESNAQPQEKLSLGIALCGMKQYVSEQGLIKEKLGFLHLKGILEILFERLGITTYNFDIGDNVYEVAVYAQNERLGIIALLKKDILDYLNIKNKDVFVAEVFLDRLLSYARLKKRFVCLARYPGISRDISLILNDNVKVDDILSAIKEKGSPLLQNLKVVDYYRGKQIPAGFKGLTVSCLYSLDERTLTESEVAPLHSSICAFLNKKFNATIRG